MIEPFSPEERETLAVLADTLIPANKNFPAPSELDVQGQGLDRLAAQRPDLLEGTRAAIRLADSLPKKDIFEVRKYAPAAFETFAAAVSAIYLTEPVVKNLLGYPGRPALDVGSPEANAEELIRLTQGVRERGSIWHETPVLKDVR